MRNLLSGILTVAVTIMFGMPLNAEVKAGQHNGEKKQFEVNIDFYGSYGSTITNSQGTFYKVWGWTFYENKVYQEKYWGTFPLYFFGTPTGVTITIKNIGPRAKAKFRIKTECYVLNTDGTNGAPLTSPDDFEVEIKRGETRTIDASFVTQWSPEADSGLDRFLVKVLHSNEGGGPGNAEPALILEKEGIFCPPEFQTEAEALATQEK